MEATELCDQILGGRASSAISLDSIKPKASHNSSREVEESRQTFDRFTELRQSIQACDKILDNLSIYLKSFHSDLISASNEIESLHSRSNELTRRLQNRKDLEALLGPAIEETILSPSLIRTIAEAPVDRRYLKALQDLERFESHEEVKSIPLKAIYPDKEVENLRLLAVARIREYFVSKIRSIRIPKANVQIVQQIGMLKLRRTYDFLCKYHPSSGDEIMQAYCYTMRWYYQSQFSKYHSSLQRISIKNISKSELLGSEEVSRSLGGIFSATKPTSGQNQNAVMSLGSRAKYLHDNASGIILAYLAETAKESHFLERVFRSYVVALVENASVEYLFSTEFFRTKKLQQITDSFDLIFTPTLQDGNSFVCSLISESLDALGLLICIRVCQKLVFDLQKRRVAGLESFLDKLLISLWPKLQTTMDAHCQGLQKANVSVALVNEYARSKTPLPITKRFADLYYGILMLSRESREEEPVAHSLDRLIHDFQHCLTRMAATCDPNLRNSFLFRNYDHIAGQIQESTGKFAESHKSQFKQIADSFR